MQEDKESERKGQGDSTSINQTAGGEGKEIVVGLSPFLIFLAPTSSHLDALGSLMHMVQMYLSHCLLLGGWL